MACAMRALDHNIVLHEDAFQLSQRECRGPVDHATFDRRVDERSDVCKAADSRAFEHAELRPSFLCELYRVQQLAFMAHILAKHAVHRCVPKAEGDLRRTNPTEGGADGGTSQVASEPGQDLIPKL